MSRKSSTGARLIADARDLASQMSQWLDDHIDVDDITDPMREGAQRVVETARDQMEEATVWLTDIMDSLEKAPNQGKRGRGSRLAAASAGAAGWYFFHPSHGAKRRQRIADYLHGLRQRFA